MDFKDKIKYLRLNLGATLEEIGNAVGVSKATVKRWESGEIANIRRDKIYKLAVALHTTPSYLMGWDEEPIAASSDGEARKATKETPAPVSESGRHINIVKIAGRDGSYKEKRLTDEQIKALQTIIDQMPEAPDDL